MGVKYFGQFLLERGVVTAAQLKEAIALQQARNFDLGKICTTLGFLRQRDADRLNERQRFVDQRLGELAMKEGLLTDKQLEQALQVQRRARLPLGQALVELGAFDQHELTRVLAEFDADQAPFRVEALSLPAGVPSPELAQAVIDLGRKMLVRIARLPTKLAPPQLMDPAALAGDAIASQLIDRCTVFLATSSGAARVIMEAVLGFLPDHPTRDDELDGVRELLNVIVVSAATKLSERGQRVMTGEPFAHEAAVRAEGRVLQCVLPAAQGVETDTIVLTLAWQ